MRTLICPVCGKEVKTAQSNQSTCSKECGIIFRDRNRAAKLAERVCIICGKTFAPRTEAALRCDACRGKQRRECRECGESYVCFNQSTRTLCDACLPAHLREVRRMRKPVIWSKEARQKRKEIFRRPEEAAHIAEIQKLAVEKARVSPLSGPYETNVSAKHWVLESPKGGIYEVDNLSLFIREHPKWFPNPKSARTALSACARWLYGPLPRTGGPVYHYKGWTVLKRPEYRNRPSKEKEGK